jgi:hypothetical protein
MNNLHVLLTPLKIDSTISNQTPPITPPITTNAAPIPNTKPFFAFTDSAMAIAVLQTGDDLKNKCIYL